MNFNYFEVHLVDHCNLNCQSCDNFSPLADEIYVNKLKFNRDLRRLSILAKDKIKNVRMLGGEPLLHPEVSTFLKISRNYFPEANVRLTTNGIKLSKMPENFWRTCNETKAIIEITYYPININKEESYNTYENRFIYSLIQNMKSFIARKKSLKPCKRVNIEVVCRLVEHKNVGLGRKQSCKREACVLTARESLYLLGEERLVKAEPKKHSAAS